MRILFLSRWFPYPPDNGARLRVFNLLSVLAKQHQVDLVSFYQEPVTQAQVDKVRQFCGQVEIVEYMDFRPHSVNSILGYLSFYPRSVKDTYNREMAKVVSQLQRINSYDAVIASEIDMAPYGIRLENAFGILEELELRVYYDRNKNAKTLIAQLASGISFRKYRRYVRDLLGSYLGCTVVSEDEANLVRRIVPDYKNLYIIPNAVNPADYEGSFDPPEPDTLVYPGSLTYNANFDAVNYFLREIFPLIKEKHPQVRFFVTGRHTPDLLSKLPGIEGVVYTGYLENVQPRISQSWVNIVPLRMGAGTRLKILESLVLRTPVVSTTKGVEGLALEPEKEVIVRDDPVGFAQAVIELLESREKRDQIAEAGYQVVVNRYSWEQVGDKYLKLLSELSAQYRQHRKLN